MHLQGIKGTNMDLTEAIKQYVEDKIATMEKLVEDFEPTVEVKVEVGKTSNRQNKGDVFRAEIQMHVPGADFRAEETGENLYAAIDSVKSQMKRQITDYKRKLSDRSQKAVRPGKE
mgnify:CR=1 FL=1|jgi:putative sigma-54 modulation protein